jgi:ABC-type glycerol-3-phosphate transport system substrate-binding protein
MKKICKAKTAVALLTAMLLAAFGVSCQKQETGGTAQAPKTVDYSEHETFTAWLYATKSDFYSDYSENPVVRYLGNKYNITLQFQQPVSGTESDAMALMFGTGEYTDMIETTRYTGSLGDLYKDGVIIDIADYLGYMPNFKGHIDGDENIRRQFYDDDGRILTLRAIRTESELMWGGLVYRRDILETMTGGNIQFPSGNEHPTTIEDCDYMLPLFKTYFEKAGMKEDAPLIIPYFGFFGTGELASGFGAATAS